MARKVELVFDKEIHSNRIVGLVQIVIGIAAAFISLGFLLVTGPNAQFLFAFLTAVFMVVTGMHTRRR